MDDNFKKDAEQILKTFDGFPLAVINNELEKLTNKYNNTGQKDFDGLSPAQMRKLLYHHCDENMIRIKDNKGSDIPLIKQISYYLNLIEANKEIKLTKAGNLPPAIVKELYSQKFISDRDIEAGITKLTKETDSVTIELTNIVCQISRLIKKRNGKISLTDAGKKILTTENYLPLILRTFCSKFNWAYFDRFGDEKVGQFGCYYTVYLLAKYGDTKQESLFYANKYFQAFFKEYVGINTEYHICYARRAFDRFLNFFGFLENYEENQFITEYVKKSELFDKYIEIKTGISCA
ncbi:MAG: hypothetical protein LBK13_03895 [Spirochaetales bacterium]|jgi:hypothetical protein|nr:hypothetical protein [Spirochaetales bacterium]